MSLKKSWVAVEEFDENVENVDLMEVPSETLEADLIEIEGLDKDIESLIEDGAELEHDQEQIDALTENAEASLDEDGMDETAARATEIAAEAFTAKWGVKRQKVGLESFASTDGRRRATQVAVESLKDAAVNMWTTFINWLKELVAKAKGQLLKLTNAGKSLKKRAEKLEARLDKGLGTLDKKEVDGDFVKQLVVDEKPDYQACLSFADKSSADVEKMARAIFTGIDQAGKLMRAGEVTGASGAIVERITGGFGKKISKRLNVPHGASDIAVSALPGNGYLVKYTVDGVQSVRYESAADKIKDSKMTTLTAEQCKDGVKSLFAISDVLETKLTEFGKANDAIGKLADSAKEAQGKLKDADAEGRDDAEAALKAARAAVSNAKAIERAAVSSLKNAGSGIAGYIAASIGAYKAA